MLPGDVVAEPAGVARDGHTLAGWTLEGQPYDFARRMTESHVGKTYTLAAAWKAAPATDPGQTPGSDTQTGGAIGGQAGGGDGTGKGSTLATTGDGALPFALLALAALAAPAALAARRKALRG